MNFKNDNLFVNISEGITIHIGDCIYQYRDADAEISLVFHAS